MPADVSVITIHTDGGLCIVGIGGEVDLLNATDLERQIAAASDGRRELTLDLAAVTYFDSTGLHLLERTRRRCTDRGIAIQVVCPAGSITRRILDISGMAPLFVLHESCTTNDASWPPEAVAL